MSSLFKTYLELGFDHISDITAYDHILFIVALCAIYTLKEWKHVVILVTAFTIGHSVTLALAAMDIVRFPTKIIEFLIPVTIFITALLNVIRKQTIETVSISKGFLNVNYWLALFFGLVHGMGFSNFLRSTLMPGQESQLVKQLFAFNVGLELGQIIIVLIILFASFIALNILKVKRREWTLIVSGAAMGISVILMMETKFW